MRQFVIRKQIYNRISNHIHSNGLTLKLIKKCHNSVNIEYFTKALMQLY